MPDGNSSIYALLIGINEYINTDELPTLGGCVNDVDAMEQLLRDVYRVPQDNILKLTNAQAKHQHIKDAFRAHLIGAAQRWTADGRQGEPPAFLFHYSGHGSQAIDETGTEPDGLDETICPHDSRTEGVYDIKDWELDQLISELTVHSDNVTIVLDCCHSGSGTRALKSQVMPVRRAPPDLRPQPNRRPPSARQTRGISGPSDWLRRGKHVLIAGCRDRELSNEYLPRESQRQQGVLTYFLIQELSKVSPRPLLYRALHERVRAQVNAVYKDQMPQCEGDFDREVFGGARPAHDVFLVVEEKQASRIFVSGGVTHGLKEGSLLHVYPPGTLTVGDAGEPIAALEIEEVGAVRSQCRSVSPKPGVAATRPSHIPLAAPVLVSRINYGDMRRRVLLDADAAVLPLLRQRLEQAEVEPYVEIVETGGFDFRIEAVGQTFEIQDKSGALLVAPFDQADLDGVARDLQHLVRYHNALALRNTAPGSELQSAVSVRVKKLALDADTGEPRAIDLPPDEGGETVVEAGTRVVFEITNHWDRPLHVALFDFSPDWSVSQLYPDVAGAHEQLLPGRTTSIGLSRRSRDQLEAQLPEGMPEGHDVFKVIATLADADFELLQQGPLKTPFQKRSAKRGAGAPPSDFDRLLEQAMHGGRTRAYGAPRSSVNDEWITEQITVRTLRPPEDAEITVLLAPDQETELPSYGIAVKSPAGFGGTVRVLTERQSTRAAGGSATALQPPPGLAGFAELFQPLELRATRGTGATGTVIELEAERDARHKITPETPLEIRLSGATTRGANQAEALLALSHDGEFFYPVGRSGKDGDTLQVEWLPDPARQDDPTAGEDGPPTVGKRSIRRMVKLYLYKVLHWNEPTLGLFSAQFVPSGAFAGMPPDGDERVQPLPLGEVRYRRIGQGALQAGQSVALFVHGFQSETWGMVAEAATFFAAHNRRYHHILTYDYESFNTHIRDNGKQLADLLRAAGFGPNDGITLDVYAHSMGTLVTRCMVELEGGNEFVDRCFLAGPPNAGTELARWKNFVTWLLTLLINQAGSTPPALVASWALKRVSNDAIGPTDLHPTQSQVIKDLVRSAPAGRVPYYILAGTNELTDEAKTTWQRLLRMVYRGIDMAADLLFKSQNDLVIGVDSMLSLRSKYPDQQLRDRVVPCHHFAYFHADEPLAQLEAWL